MQRGLKSPLKQTSCPFSDQPTHCLPQPPFTRKCFPTNIFANLLLALHSLASCFSQLLIVCGQNLVVLALLLLESDVSLLLFFLWFSFSSFLYFYLHMISCTWFCSNVKKHLLLLPVLMPGWELLKTTASTSKDHLICFCKQNFPIKSSLHILLTHLQLAMIITIIIYHLPLQIDISPDKVKSIHSVGM